MKLARAQRSQHQQAEDETNSTEQDDNPKERETSCFFNVYHTERSSLVCRPEFQRRRADEREPIRCMISDKVRESHSHHLNRDRDSIHCTQHEESSDAHNPDDGTMKSKRELQISHVIQGQRAITHVELKLQNVRESGSKDTKMQNNRAITGLMIAP